MTTHYEMLDYLGLLELMTHDPDDGMGEAIRMIREEALLKRHPISRVHNEVLERSWYRLADRVEENNLEIEYPLIIHC